MLIRDTPRPSTPRTALPHHPRAQVCAPQRRSSPLPYSSLTYREARSRRLMRCSKTTQDSSPHESSGTWLSLITSTHDSTTAIYPLVNTLHNLDRNSKDVTVGCEPLLTARVAGLGPPLQTTRAQKRGRESAGVAASSCTRGKGRGDMLRIT